MRYRRRGFSREETGAAHMDRTDVAVNNHSPPAAKIALFRSLFRGREDIYPRRFESLRTGKSGYQPACANEWARGLCDKRAVRCAECPNRRFLPVTDEVVRWHLSGRDDTGRDFVMGVYRRDRRKDLLLQENGYFVLRYLAEDVGTHLDDVLDAILRTLAHRQRGRS